MTAPRRLPRRAASVLAMVPLVLAVTAVSLPAEAGKSDYRLDRATERRGDPVVRWNPCQTEVTYKANLTYAGSSSAARSAALRDVKGAVARVSSATGIHFTYEGGTTQVPRSTSSAKWWDRQQSTEIVIAWVRQSKSSARSNLLGGSGSGWAAGTGGYVYKTHNSTKSGRYVAPIGRGFVVLNSAQNRAFRSGFGSGSTRGALLMHELGHVMGLQHVGATSEIMYPTILRRTRTYYRSGDRAGLARVGRPAGCISVPSSIWRQV
ncbi:MAG: matrixin family metalloprotease [Actinomycetes bacterium]